MIRRILIRRILTAACALALPLALSAQDASVQVQPPDLQGSRQLEPLTATSVVRDYLESWKSFRAALDQNSPQLLDQDFVGTALTRLSHTIAEQSKLGLHTRYTDRAHHLQIVFYSPDGMSIQLVDRVDYDEQVMQGNTVLATQPVHARYLVVLTPSQTRWQVRIFQASTK
jgi:hypothetical protein